MRAGTAYLLCWTRGEPKPSQFFDQLGERVWQPVSRDRSKIDSRPAMAGRWFLAQRRGDAETQRNAGDEKGKVKVLFMSALRRCAFCVSFLFDEECALVRGACLVVSRHDGERHALEVGGGGNARVDRRQRGLNIGWA